MLALLISVAGLSPCQGAVTITAAEVGSDVVFTYSGNINTTSLGAPGNFTISTFGDVTPNEGSFVSRGGGTLVDRYLTAVSPDDVFGVGNETSFTSATGDIFGFHPQFNQILLPDNYVSGAGIFGTATITNKNFADLGLTSGSYAYVIAGDSITMNIGSVPEPARALYFGLGLVGLLFRRRR